MDHDVFISHAHKDKRVANAICEKMESARVRCWIAERDIAPGEDWTEVTRRAIESSRVMVLLLSENANTSPHIEREIAHAFYTKRKIIPVRLTQALPRRGFLFYLGTLRCFDAFSPSRDKRLDVLTTSVTDLVLNCSAPGQAIPLHNALVERAASRLPNSWIGALQASKYGTLRFLKWATIAVCIVSAAGVAWSVFSQNRTEQNDLRTMVSDSHDRQDSLSKNPSISHPTYTYTRFGLWTPYTDSSPSVQQGNQNPATRTGAVRTPSPPPAVAQNGGIALENFQAGEESANKKPEQEIPARVKNRREGHRGRWRHRIHNQPVRSPD